MACFTSEGASTLFAFDDSLQVMIRQSHVGQSAKVAMVLDDVTKAG